MISNYKATLSDPITQLHIPLWHLHVPIWLSSWDNDGSCDSRNPNFFSSLDSITPGCGTSKLTQRKSQRRLLQLFFPWYLQLWLKHLSYYPEQQRKHSEGYSYAFQKADADH